jgi:hypothetical protein
MTHDEFMALVDRYAEACIAGQNGDDDDGQGEAIHAAIRAEVERLHVEVKRLHDAVDWC